MRESHACELKTSISRITDNFSRLTHKFNSICTKIRQESRLKMTPCPNQIKTC